MLRCGKEKSRAVFMVYFLLKKLYSTPIARSSNGRMRLSESRHLGSNPSLAANELSEECCRKKALNALLSWIRTAEYIFLTREKFEPVPRPKFATGKF